MLDKILFLSCLYFCNVFVVSYGESSIDNDRKNIKNIKEYKPQINKNTQTRVEYGCKRPDWGTYEYFTPYDGKIISCYFNTRNVVLYNNSKVVPQIDIKQCKKGNQDKLCCKVVSGEWELKNNDKNIVVNNPKQIQIDHILPYSYLRLNMKDCKMRHKYFNYLPNLTPELADVNLKKSDYLCLTFDECKKQKDICEAMSIEFNDEHLCDELNKIDLEKQQANSNE